MRLVTIMNYSDPIGIAMCKGWLYLARRFCKAMPITVLHRDPIPEIIQFATNFNSVEIQQMSTKGILEPELSGRFGRPAQFFKLGLWRWAELAGLEEFVFIDADAWIVRDISPLFEAAKQKAFVCTTERVIEKGQPGEGEPLLNTGVFAYSKSRKLGITYGKLLEEFERCGKSILAPTGDQGLLWSYFRRLGYNWELPEIGQEYNTFANGIRVEKLGDSIEVYAAEKPPAGIEPWASEWLGWGNREPARIVHAISKYKWWTLHETGPLWDYVGSEIDFLEKGGGQRIQFKDDVVRRNPDRKFASWILPEPVEPAKVIRPMKEFTQGLVSVVIPTYNRPELLRHAIGMIRQQTYRPIEIIIVDDSDSDQRIPQIKAPDITHIQLNRRFSTGLKHDMAMDSARGEWICHWDDDDWYAPDRIERQLKMMTQSGAVVSGMDRDFVLSIDGSWWHIQWEGDDLSWLGNATCKAFYDFHDGTAIFRRDAVPDGASYGDHVVSQKVWLLNAIVKAGAHWIKIQNSNRFVYVRHKKNVWQFDEKKVRRPAERPAWFPENEYQFYTALPR